MTTSAQAEPRTGIWLIGARGSVATTGVARVLWCNPVAFYGLSGRLNLDVAATDATHEGNSILRGEA